MKQIKMLLLSSMVILFTACGGGSSTSETPDPVNSLPNVDAGPDKSVEVNQAVTITGSASDDDGTIVSLEWTKDSTVLATTASFDYIPTAIGTDTLTLTVMDDDGATASDSMNVVVLETNQAPTADAGADQSVVVVSTVTLDGSGSSDPDSNPITYDWTFVTRPSGSTSSLSNSTTASPTFVADQVGTYEVRLTVSDGSLTDSDTVTITATVSFANDVMPILVTNCAGCHSTSSQRTFKVGDAAYTHNNIITNSLINITSPDLSTLLIKGNGGDGHTGGDQLCCNESPIIREWIEEGGLNN